MRTLLVLSAVLLCTSAAVAAPLWVQKWGPDATNIIMTNAVTTDTVGNIYVCGKHGKLGVTLKYSPDGYLLWSREAAGPTGYSFEFYDIGVDAAGNVYCGGVYQSSTIVDFAIIKYDAAGTKQWVKYYDAGKEDWGGSLAVTSYGVVMTGISDSVDNDIVTIAYRPDGSVLWQNRFFNTGDDIAARLQADNAGNIYVSGFNMNAVTYSDFITLKYNASGVYQWLRRYNSPGNGDDRAVAIALDPSNGSVVVAGTSYLASSMRDYLAVAYSSSGDTLWAQRYAGPGNCGIGSCDDWGNAVAVSSSHVAFVTGYGNRGAAYEDVVTVAYDGAGVEPNWIQPYDGSAHRNDQGMAIAATPSGSVVVVGASEGVSSQYDCLTIKYGATGSIEWSDTYDSPDHMSDNAVDVAIDKAGNIITVGTSASLAGNSMLIIKYPGGCCAGTTGNVNMTGIVDLADLSTLIAYLTAPVKPVLPCPGAANINATGIIDLSDLSMLIAYLTAPSKPVLPPCP